MRGSKHIGALIEKFNENLLQHFQPTSDTVQCKQATTVTHFIQKETWLYNHISLILIITSQDTISKKNKY